jgi:hypothetical protein
MIYRKRRNVFEKGEYEWRVTEDALIARDPDGVETRHEWRAIRSVRLSYAPTRIKARRYIMILRFGSGARIEIDNMHYRGFADFEERSKEYGTFARAMLERVAAAAPELKVRIGTEPLSYALQLLMVAIAFLFLAIIVLTLPAPHDYFSDVTWTRFGIILAMLPVFFLWIRRARPQLARPDALPTDALPVIEAPVPFPGRA